MDSVFNRNIALKLISILVAIILWFIAIREQNPEITRRFDNIRITVTNEEQLEPKGFTLTQRIGDKATIQLRGRAHDFAGANTDEIMGYVDLSRVTKSGEQYLPIELRGLPPGMSLQKTPQVWISIESLTSKIIPVTFEMDVSEAYGYKLQPYKMTPEDSIRVLGPASILNRIEKAFVSLNVSDASQTIKRSLSVKLFDRNDQLVQHEYVSTIPSHIVVVIPVYPVKTLSVTPSIIGTPAHGYEIKGVEVYPAEIVVSGDIVVVNAMQDISTEILDIQNVANDVRRTINIKEYHGIRIVEGQPANVSILVRIGETVIYRNISINNIETLNPPRNRRIQFGVQNVEITLSGPQRALEALVEEDITVNVDLSNTTSGENILPLQVNNIPHGVKLVEISPQTVTVTIN